MSFCCVLAFGVCDFLHNVHLGLKRFSEPFFVRWNGLRGLAYNDIATAIMMGITCPWENLERLLAIRTRTQKTKQGAIVSPHLNRALSAPLFSCFTTGLGLSH